MTKSECITKALDYARRYGGTDGAHHKDWVIDQMVRALTNCPDNSTSSYNSVQGKSKEYKKYIADCCAGEDGPETYSWDEGIAP